MEFLLILPSLWASVCASVCVRKWSREGEENYKPT